MSRYLEELNDSQRAAVQAMRGPVMIIAGAGSGKTKVLTSRIAYLISSGVDAFRIMALTFTNKAAQEIKHRIEQMLGSTESRNVYAGTFHSIFARILRVEASYLGYTNNFTIYDVEDSKQVLKQILHDLSIDSKVYRLNTVYNRICNAKNEFIMPEEYEQDEIRKAYDIQSQMPRIWEIYKYYAMRCFRNNAMDFEDILFNTYKLFHQFPEVLHKYQHQIQYILIDEFQDTNPLQYAIIRRLANVHENICVVGDDAQSIYSFRGATIQNILQFRNDYPDTQLFKLEQNYRSTKHILDTANTLIKNNKNQIEKNLWTHKEATERVTINSYQKDQDEARGVVDKIMEIKLRHQISNNEIAILYRTNAQSRVFEEQLRKQGIPYVIYGGFSFYQRKEIKDLLSYLKVILNPKDDEAIKRIINYPIRGIGESSINKFSIFSFENNCSLYDVLRNIQHFESRILTVQAVQKFVQMMDYFCAEASKITAYELATLVAKQTGMLQELHEDKTPEGIARMQNIEELLNSIQSFVTDENEQGEMGDLAAYLQQVALVTSGDEHKQLNEQTVKLMTVHAAKGLEFECVFVTGVQEGVFPNALSVNTRDELEEERRLFYVAITRAKKYLFVSYSAMYYKRGSLQYSRQSMFIEEIFKSASGVVQGSLVSYKRPDEIGHTDFKQLMRQRMLLKKSEHMHHTSTNFSPTQDFSKYAVGKKIEHEKFGYGVITSLSNDQSLIATIIFEKMGEKKIMLRYAKTQLVE